MWNCMEITFATFTVMSQNLLKMPDCDIISNGTHSSVLQSQVFLHSRLICAKVTEAKSAHVFNMRNEHKMKTANY